LLTLIANGVPILKALEVVRETMSNEVLKAEMESVLKDVRDGVALATAMKGALHFSPFVINMVAVGEESGKLEDSLKKVSSAYERDVDRVMKVITSLFEPVMILIMGSIVGFIVVAMLLPIFQISVLVK
jgi:general secretion pathway protein F